MPIGKYQYRRNLRRINDGRQIPGLFDVPQKLKVGRSVIYSGTICGLPARISYTDNLQYIVSAQTQEHLETVYNSIMNKLLGTEPNGNGNGNRSLAEILGIKQ